ncbi:hypothetical protein [Pseudonocardia halophobica]|nr:hypothetical protein [Pseudonocardia halophobica]
MLARHLPHVARSVAAGSSAGAPRLELTRRQRELTDLVPED